MIVVLAVRGGDKVRRDGIGTGVVNRFFDDGHDGVHGGAKRSFRGGQLGPKVADLRLKSRVVGWQERAAGGVDIRWLDVVEDMIGDAIEEV
jgi:hypothetical protein